MLLLLDNEAQITLEGFLDANTKRVDPDIEPINEDDVQAIEFLKLNEVYHLPVHFGWCEIKRIA